ncbi:MAG: PQQ-binding-like beta-propeller repeat protein [Planctomycetota bacterium]|nr:PQQ-binding-like beta-propeller repeat protein [Planctomycetota bacterium]
MQFMGNRPSLVCSLMMLVFVLAIPGQAEDWPQFRGPNCAGISSSKEALAAEFSPTKNVHWSVSLGDGIGCPVVAAGRVFVSSMVDEDTVALTGFDVRNGKQLWQRTWPAGELVEIHKTNSQAATTPCADAERVYFYFSTIGLVAVDAQTGEDEWKIAMPVPFFVFKWGAGMSPVLHGDKLIFCQDDDIYPGITVVQADTGKVVWKESRDDMAVNYSHPVIVETQKRTELVVAGTGKIVGYDLVSGKRLWESRTLLRNIKTTPVVVGNTIYISLQSGGIANQWLASIDRAETGNNDNRIDKPEIQAFVGKQVIPEAFYRRTFDRGDENKDGFLEGIELDKAFLHPDNMAGAAFDSEEPADEYILAVTAGGDGDVTESHTKWKTVTKYTDHIVSPLIQNGRMLLIKGGGISTVYDTVDGKQLQGPKRIENSSEYFASPVFGDGKVYVAGENGVVVVLDALNDFKLLAKNDMQDAILGTPAIADGSLFIRTRTKLFCIRK